MTTRALRLAELSRPTPWRTFPLAMMLSLGQIGIAYYVSLCFNSTTILILSSYIVGAFFSHALTVVLHEFGHNLCFASRSANHVGGILLSVPLGLPVSRPFIEFHRYHHIDLCIQTMDPDVPLPAEIWVFDSFGWVGKLIWLILQPILYSVRPMVMGLPIRDIISQVINVGLVIIWHALLFYIIDPSGRMSLYLIMSTIFASSLHPAGMHILFEHYPISLPAGSTAPQTYKTFSYYGWFNYLCLGLGYHREHHDFPMVPCYHLPEIRTLFPERFPEDGCVRSLWTVFTTFVFDPKITLHNRASSFAKEKS